MTTGKSIAEFLIRAKSETIRLGTLIMEYEKKGDQEMSDLETDRALVLYDLIDSLSYPHLKWSVKEIQIAIEWCDKEYDLLSRQAVINPLNTYDIIAPIIRTDVLYMEVPDSDGIIVKENGRLITTPRFDQLISKL